MNLVRGYWEAKDTADKLDAEIEKKRKAGYPNIAQAAVDEMLIQHILTERLIREILDRAFGEQTVSCRIR